MTVTLYNFGRLASLVLAKLYNVPVVEILGFVGGLWEKDGMRRIRFIVRRKK